MSFHCYVLCLQSSKSWLWTSFKLQREGSLLTELKAANRTAFYLCVRACQTIRSLCMCVTFPARLVSPVLMDGVFRCEKVNRSPKEFHTAVCHYKLVCLVCPCVCMNILKVGLLVCVCAQRSAALLSFTGCCVTVCTDMCVCFLLKTEQPAWFQPPVGFVAFEEMKCQLASPHALPLIWCPSKYTLAHTNTKATQCLQSC